MSYGIDVKSLPVDSEGRLQKKDHIKFVKTRRSQELFDSEDAFTNAIIVPANSDVLVGRGGAIL